MTDAQSSSSITVEPSSLDAARANLELAESLREVALWLEMHAGDLPAMRASAHVDLLSQGGPRADLTALAKALGDRANEERMDIGEVRISGWFGPVRVWAVADERHLLAAPLPAYPPIIPSDPPVSAAEDAAFAERGWKENRDA